MPKIFIFALIASTLVSFTFSDCDKQILDLDTYKLKYTDYTAKDYKLAYNKAASCATYTAPKEYQTCCYIKLKFENLLNEEKYTHTGCIPINITTLLDDANPDIDDVIDNIEGSFDNANKGSLESKEVEIDCGSKFIHLASLALLILLL